MPKISSFKSRVIINSRGEKTIESEIKINESKGRYSSPSGASKGTFEAPSFPNGGINQSKKLLDNEIAPKLLNFDFSSQSEIDTLLRTIDGSNNYSRIGGSASLSISLAVAEAAAKNQGIPLYNWILKNPPTHMPLPLGNIIGGGSHSLGQACDIQEFLAVPLNPSSFKDSVFALISLHREVGEILINTDEFFLGGRNDEGAWCSSLHEDDILTALSEAINNIKKQTGIKFGIGLDIAAGTLWNQNTRTYSYKRTNMTRNRDDQIEYILNLIKKYDLLYVEDPLHDQDFPGFTEITQKTKNTLICGDDLYVTSVSRLGLGAREKAGNSVIIKPNQVGDLTGSQEAADIATQNGFKIIVSHRSGETPTSHLAHIALGLNAIMIKTGVMGGERVIKLNELIRLEEELKANIKMSKLS